MNDIGDQPTPVIGVKPDGSLDIPEPILHGGVTVAKTLGEADGQTVDLSASGSTFRAEGLVFFCDTEGERGLKTFAGDFKNIVLNDPVKVFGVSDSLIGFAATSLAKVTIKGEAFMAMHADLVLEKSSPDRLDLEAGCKMHALPVFERKSDTDIAFIGIRLAANGHIDNRVPAINESVQ